MPFRGANNRSSLLGRRDMWAPIGQPERMRSANDLANLLVQANQDKGDSPPAHDATYRASPAARDAIIAVLRGYHRQWIAISTGRVRSCPPDGSVHAPTNSHDVTRRGRRRVGGIMPGGVLTAPARPMHPCAWPPTRSRRRKRSVLAMCSGLAADDHRTFTGGSNAAAFLCGRLDVFPLAIDVTVAVQSSLPEASVDRVTTVCLGALAQFVLAAVQLDLADRRRRM